MSDLLVRGKAERKGRVESNTGKEDRSSHPVRAGPRTGCCCLDWLGVGISSPPTARPGKGQNKLPGSCLRS